jgi:carbamoyltransferase
MTTRQTKLCLAGGVAFNCVGNGRVLREGPFEDIWIQPASSDAGGALGAALFVWYKYLGNERTVDGVQDRQKASFLGPEFNNEYIEQFLVKQAIPYRQTSYVDIPVVVSDLIAQGNVVGWFQGKSEFGPRALGARSILGDPRNPEMQSKLNLKIKYRESFRPFAPTVLKEHTSEWFDLDRESPYMLLVAPVKQEKRLPPDNNSQIAQGFDKLKQRRSLIPAVTHVDYSARIQTIKRDDHQLFYDAINEFYKRTGCPVIINTSFNVRGEPLVCSPEEAYRCFMRTEMDYLIMGHFLLSKAEQKRTQDSIDWHKEFELD